MMARLLSAPPAAAAGNAASLPRCTLLAVADYPDDRLTKDETEAIIWRVRGCVARCDCYDVLIALLLVVVAAVVVITRMFLVVGCVTAAFFAAAMHSVVCALPGKAAAILDDIPLIQKLLVSKEEPVLLDERYYAFLQKPLLCVDGVHGIPIAFNARNKRKERCDVVICKKNLRGALQYFA
jgi:hypothetical protein